MTARFTPPLTMALALLAGCAGELWGRRAAAPAASTDSEAGWAALVDGRHTDATTRFAAALARRPDEPLARFGDASLAFERGDSARAVRGYLAVLESAAGPAAREPGQLRAGEVAFPGVVAMSAGRLAVLLDEFGGAEGERRAIEDRLLALRTQDRSADMPWEARHVLATLGDDVARRRGDVRLMARLAQSGGCVRAFRVGRPAGTLPHLDLDTPASGAAPADRGGPARTVHSVGCLLAIPAFEGRAGAQRVFATIDAEEAGAYDLVLAFRGEARLAVDGGRRIHHGGETEFGPRVSATRVTLSRGSHVVELRLASFGGNPELMLMVVPARDAQRPAAAALPSPALAMAQDFAETYVANRRGYATRSWQGAARLEKAPRFALGLALAAAVARDDPSAPANFTRDRARALLRAVVTLDPQLARSRHALAAIALDDDRPREAIDEAQAAVRAAPGWWLPEWTLYGAYRLRGLTWDADRALDRALAHGAGACPLIETALGRAEDRHDVDAEKRFAAALDVCGRDSDQRVERLRRVGDLAGAEAALRRRSALAPEREDEKLNLATVLLARGQAREAANLMAEIVVPGDVEGHLRLVDALVAAGARDRARGIMGAVLAAHPESLEVNRAARALGLPLPLDAFRLDGRQVIQAFEAARRDYPTPAVVVLDRTVTRIFSSGAEMVLTHEIVRVQSKDAVQKWGEISVPERSQILVLRTHKADGSTREPEEFAGKDAISAADLAVGDYVEKETLETRPPRDAFVVPAAGRGERRGGFLGDRFYFQSFDAPLDRSEYLLVTTRDSADRMHLDRRAGAPEARRTPVAGAAGDVALAPGAGATPEPLVLTTFAASRVPQLFAERSSVAPIEHVPSVRVSMGVGWTAWTRFLTEQMYGTVRSAPALTRAAAAIRALSPGAEPQARASALVAWVGHNVEADEDLRDLASFSVTRGRGNRLAVLLALARELGLDARPVLARSRMTADGPAPAPLEEADDFAEPLVRLALPRGQLFYVDPRLKHAPLGYLPPGLDGARVLLLDSGRFEVARSRADDHRAVDVVVRLDAQGGGVAEAVETVRGWPALEWAEVVDRFGSDPAKLRQDFEQRWLGVHFPGAVLNDLRIEVISTPASAPGAARPARAEPPSGGVVATAPGAPYLAAAVRLRYAFSSPRLAVKREREIRFLPSFFRSQPGRRYATEPRRSTALLTGFDVPLELRARVQLPPGGQLLGGGPAAAAGVAAGAAAGARTLISGPAGSSDPAGSGAGAGYRFLEERGLDADSPGSPVLLLRRQSRLPIMRVPLPAYPALAAELRRVDALEQEEVRIGMAPERP